MLYSIEELKHKAYTEIPQMEWLKDLYAFIRHWLDETDSIEVKTSGSTGLPKIIRHKKEVMLQSAKMTCDFLDLRPDMHALLCMSVRNIAGMMMVVRAIERKIHLIIVPPDGHPLKSVPFEETVHFAAMVPAQVFNSFQDETEKEKLNSIHDLIIGGAPISYTLEQKIRQLKGNVYATFGMTETMSHIALRKISGNEHSDEYLLLKGISIDTGDDGNLIVHAPYLGNSPLITNDIVHITGPHTFKWLGRKDHVINTGGFKLYPEALESAIAPVMAEVFKAAYIERLPEETPASHSTLRYFIASEDNEKLGQIPVLVLEMTKPADFNDFSASLTGQLAQVLKKHEIPQKVYFAEKFIETPTHKIIRSATLKRIR